MPIIGVGAPRSSPDKLAPRPEAFTRDVSAAWTLLGWVGLAFVITGMADIALGVYPTAFGDPEWEFGTISGVLNGFAIPTMGTYLFLASAVARNRGWVVKTTVVWMMVVAFTVVMLALLYLTVAPLALRAVDKNALLHSSMKKAIVKATVLQIAYLALYIGGGIKAWRSVRPS